MSIHLLDINILIALLDKHHCHHTLTIEWFLASDKIKWATCPLTENGLVRILSSKAYPNAILYPSQACILLKELKEYGHHHFWEDSVSILDWDMFKSTYITHSKHITDVYLVGLAKARKGKLVTLDRKIKAPAVENAELYINCLIESNSIPS